MGGGNNQFDFGGNGSSGMGGGGMGGGGMGGGGGMSGSSPFDNDFGGMQQNNFGTS